MRLPYSRDNKENKIVNKSLEHIIKIIIISGLIEVIGLATTIVLSNVQQNTYESIIENEYKIDKNISSIIVNTYQLQNIAMNYMSQNDISEDFSHEIEQIDNNSMDYISFLQNNKSLIEESKSIDKIEEINVHYKLLLSQVNMVLNDSETDDSISIISKELQTIQNTCVILQMYNAAKRDRQSEYIKNLNNLSKLVDLIVVIIAICSVMVCMYISGKNATEMAEKQALAEQKAKTSQKKSYTDVLTGLWNRKYTEMVVTKYIDNGLHGCLFMMDMDNFKSVNDIYGHRAGDNVIIEFANVLRQSARSNDICCRLGGDEFMLFAKNINRSQAYLLAERIKEMASAELSKLEGGKVVTVSMGAAMIEKNIKSFQQLYELADNSLYYIKENGKSGFKMSENGSDDVL